MHHDFHDALYLPVRLVLLAATVFWVLAAVSSSAMPGLVYDEGPIPTDAYLNRQLFAAAMGALVVGLPFRWSNTQPLFAIRLLVCMVVAAWVITDFGVRNIITHGGRAIPGTTLMVSYFAAAAWCAFESRRKIMGGNTRACY